MNHNIALIILYSVALLVIGFLLYSMIHRPQQIKPVNQLAQFQQFPSDWWGYGWRPWWRQYDGLPGFGEVKPIPKPQMPNPSKPVIITDAP